MTRTITSGRLQPGLTAALLAALAAGCGKAERSGDGDPPAAASTLDCARFTARVKVCAADFWSAYGGTARARSNAARGDVAGHVAEVRATLEAVGLDKMCANERQAHGDHPAWARVVEGCARARECAAWAACAAPALVAGPR